MHRKPRTCPTLDVMPAYGCSNGGTQAHGSTASVRSVISPRVPLHGSLGSPADVQVGFVSRSFLEDPIPTELARWARRNDCGPKPTLSKVATGITLIAYQCPDHDTVELYREDGDGHTWPGSALTNLPAVRATLGRTTFAIDADHLIWAFFQSHQLPR